MNTRVEGLLRCALAVLLLLVPARAAAQLVVSLELDPPAPTTGDPLTVTVTVLIPQDCGWQATASIGFGRQAELDPIQGWGLDVALERSFGVCDKPIGPFVFRLPLGTLPLASGPGVLRLTVDDRPPGLEFFSLSVEPGPAPGWGEATLHGTDQLFIIGAGLTALAERRIAVTDALFAEIVVLDPLTLAIEGSIPTGAISGNVRGLAFDGSSLYASVPLPFGPRIFKLDLEGRVLAEFPSPTVTPGRRALEGLAFHAGVLYGTHESPPLLFAIDPVSGDKLWSRPLPLRILGLTSIPVGLLGVEPGGILLLIEPSPDGEDLVIVDPLDLGIIGAPALPQMVGLAYDGFRLLAWDASGAFLRSIRTLALWWDRDGMLRSYVPRDAQSVDVIRGRVAEIFQFAGVVLFDGTICLQDDGDGGVIPPDADPPPGEAFIYLARMRGPFHFNTSYGRSSAGFRRVESFSGLGACP